MAAPIFLQQGNLAGVTTGNLTVTIPAVEQADDILVVTTVAWVPNTTTGANTIAAPSGWTKFTPDVTTITGGLIDAEYSFFWKRAVGGDADPVFVRPTGWDTGTDTNWSGRCYVIRGCVTTGDPWDSITSTAVSTAQNPAFPAITVSGNGRLAVVFAVKADNANLPTTAAGYTAQLQLTNTTGTDAAMQSYTIASTDTSVSAVTPSGGAAPAQGGTVYFGVSFQAPVAAIDRTASGFGTGTQSASGFKTLDRTATGSGLGDGSGDDQLTHDRNASGSGVGTQSANGSILAIINRTATGAGSSDQFASGIVPVTYNRTASGASSGTQTAARVVTKLRTAISDGGLGGAIDGFTPIGLGASSTSWPTSSNELKAISFTGDGRKLSSVSFLLTRRNAGETGLLYARLYAHTGTYGTTGTGTGSPLAISTPIDVTTIPTSNSGLRLNVKFDFPDSDKYLLVDGTKYVVGVFYAASGVINPISIYGNNASTLNYYSGNSSSLTTVWALGPTLDYSFAVEAVSATGATIKSRTATGSGAGAESASGAIVVIVQQTATGSGSSSQTATAQAIPSRTSTGSGTGTESATGFKTVFRTAVGSGAGTSTADTLHNNIRSASGAGGASPSAIAVGFVTAVRTAIGSGLGTQTSTGSKTLSRTANGSGTSSQTAARSRTLFRTAIGSGLGTQASSAIRVKIRSATGAGIASPAAVATKLITRTRSASANGIGNSTSSGRRIRVALATGSGVGTQTATVSVYQVKLGGLTDFSFPYRFGGRFYVGVFVISRTATGSGAGTQSSVSQKFRVRTAAGNGIGTSSSSRLVTRRRTGTSSVGTGSSAASRVVTKLRTATASGLGISSSTALRRVIRTSNGFGNGSSSGSASTIRFRTAAGSGLGSSYSLQGILYVRTSAGSGAGGSSALWYKTLIFRPPFDGEFRWAEYGATDSTSMFFGRMRPGQKASNIYKMVDGTYTTIPSRDYSIVSRVYHGGHENLVTPEEKADLIAAGYGDYVT